MRDTVIQALQARFSAYLELLQSIDEPTLNVRIDVPKHKTLAEHLWCIVGSRESYARALAAGRWDEFSCSMTEYGQASFATALQKSAATLNKVLQSPLDWNAQRHELLMALAEHEVMHEGQIIRHMYGLGLTLPTTWRWA